MEHYSVIVSGAGPVGLLVALRLGQAGVKTLVLERHHELLPTIRAMAYSPAVLDKLKGLGLLEKIQQKATLNRQGIYWRDINCNELGHLPMREDEYVILFGQAQMNALILSEVSKCPSVQVRFGCGYVGSEQATGEEHIKVMAHDTSNNKDDDVFFTSDWLVACDGANSTVRRSLSIPFEGFSFTEFRMIGADVLYDFASEEYGNENELMNFVVHPDDWAVIIYTGEQQNRAPRGEAPPVWRVAYVESLELSSKPEDIVARAEERCARYTRHHKKLKVIRAEPYKLHQRCAAQASKGRVLLVGDALHANNPIGGLGLTTGICDAHTVGNALAHVCTGQASASIALEAAEERRQVFLNTTNGISITNLERLRSTKQEDVDERNAFFRNLKEATGMPEKVWSSLNEIGGNGYASA